MLIKNKSISMIWEAQLLFLNTCTYLYNKVRTLLNTLFSIVLLPHSQREGWSNSSSSNHQEAAELIAKNWVLNVK